MKTIFSGVQPSGNLHLGNYLGAIKNWVNLQDDYKCIFCVVDYHAITVKQDPVELKQKIIEIAKIYLASGIDPKNAIIFQQSRVGAHTELAWILNTITKVSELQRMTQFKDKAKIKIKDLRSFTKESKELYIMENQNRLIDYFDQMSKVGVGLFDYPVLMASDILLYDTDMVPVGDDQEQHVELTRTLAKRFNTQFAEVFKIPESKVYKNGARIMGLDNPNNKMSKSASSEYNYIGLLDEPEVARKKVMKAVTDTGKEIRFDIKEKPAIANLLTIYSLLSSILIKDLEKQYKGKMYGDFKKDLAEVVVKFLTDFQVKYNGFDDKLINDILDKGAVKAGEIAKETLGKVKKAVGVMPSL